MDSSSPDVIKLPSLQFLFDTDIRQAIMFDAVSEGQDFCPLVEKVEEDFGMTFENTYRFTNNADGGWLGVVLKNEEATEENILSSPTLFVHSDCEPEAYPDKTLIDHVKELLQNFDYQWAGYAEEYSEDEVTCEIATMLNEIETFFY